MFLNVWFYVACFLFVILIVSWFYLYKFSILILEMQDGIERSLDILDNRFKAMSEILQTPIFFDSLEVRQCVVEIKKCRSAILYIANMLMFDKSKINENEIQLIEESDAD